jgi:N-formylglutamate deformylase
VASGLGVVPRVVAGGRAIYRGKLSREEAEKRLARIWRPYHAKLGTLMEQARAGFGRAILIDCHSMPREALDTVARTSGRRPEIVIGDRFGASAARPIVEGVEEAFRAAGFEVVRNTPFAGAYTTQAYGRPARGLHAIQVEIDRSIYMDEKSLTPSAEFSAIRRMLRGVVAEIAAMGERDQEPLAAE